MGDSRVRLTRKHGVGAIHHVRGWSILCIVVLRGLLEEASYIMTRSSQRAPLFQPQGWVSSPTDEPHHKGETRLIAVIHYTSSKILSIFKKRFICWPLVQCYAFTLNLVLSRSPRRAHVSPIVPTPPTTDLRRSSVSLLSPNSQFPRTVTIHSTLPVVPFFMGYQTPSTDCDLPVCRSQSKISRVAGESES